MSIKCATIFVMIIFDVITIAVGVTTDVIRSVILSIVIAIDIIDVVARVANAGAIFMHGLMIT
eukprot:3709841-Alexandrium_andersonii.AAC.1